MVGVVLVNYHTNEDTANIARFYASCDCIDHVVVIDNDTNSANKESLKFDSSKIEVYYFEENQGYSKGNNVGIKKLLDKGCEFILISNSDIEIDESTIIALQREMDRNPECGALAPRMRDVKGNLTVCRKIDFGVKRMWLRVFCRDQSIDNKSSRALEENENIIYQSFVPGSFFMIRGSAAEACGGFDGDVFLYREEEILAKRLAGVGYRVGLVSNISFMHKHNYSDKTTFKTMIKKMSREFDSEKLYFKKYCHYSNFQMCGVVILQKLYCGSVLLREVIKRIIRR